MEIRNIITFQKINELNSFTKAALELGYSQSTVTMQIKQLESELKVRLFDRIGRKIQLTEDGKKFLSYANDIIVASNNAVQALKQEDNPTGELRIGVLESIATAYLPNLLKEYHTRYPKVTTVITMGVFEELSAMLNSNKIDVLWTFDTSYEVTEWNKVYHYSDIICAVSSPEHNLAKLSEVPLHMLSEETFLLTEKNCSYRMIFEQTLRTKGWNIHLFLEIGNTEMIKKFVAAGLGLSVLPHFTVKEEIERKQLSILSTPEFQLEMQGQLFVHKNKWVTPALREFVELVQEVI